MWAQVLQVLTAHNDAASAASGASGAPGAAALHYLDRMQAALSEQGIVTSSRRFVSRVLDVVLGARALGLMLVLSIIPLFTGGSACGEYSMHNQGITSAR